MTRPDYLQEGPPPRVPKRRNGSKGPTDPSHASDGPLGGLWHRGGTDILAVVKKGTRRMAEKHGNESLEEAAGEREMRLARAYAEEHEVVERLRALDEMKNAFLSALSHELRTPVTAILGLARAIEHDYERLSSEAIRELTRRLAGKASKLDRLLNDLLDLDRLRHGMLEPARRRGNIADLVRHVTEELETPE